MVLGFFCLNIASILEVWEGRVTPASAFYNGHGVSYALSEGICSKKVPNPRFFEGFLNIRSKMGNEEPYSTTLLHGAL